jgi:hypothetical protein
MDISHVTWRKASYSGGNGGGCVEVACPGTAIVAVRDSKDPDGPKLLISSPIWQTFAQRVRTAEQGPR